MKSHEPKKLVLSTETLRNLSVKTGVKAGAPTADCSNLATAC